MESLKITQHLSANSARKKNEKMIDSREMRLKKRECSHFTALGHVEGSIYLSLDLYTCQPPTHFWQVLQTLQELVGSYTNTHGCSFYLNSCLCPCICSKRKSNMWFHGWQIRTKGWCHMHEFTFQVVWFRGKHRVRGVSVLMSVYGPQGTQLCSPEPCGPPYSSGKA